MQDRRDSEILLAKSGALDELQRMHLTPGANNRVIAVLPKKGETVKIRGLQFDVKFVNRRTGEMRLRLSAAEQQLE